MSPINIDGFRFVKLKVLGHGGYSSVFLTEYNDIEYALMVPRDRLKDMSNERYVLETIRTMLEKDGKKADCLPICKRLENEGTVFKFCYALLKFITNRF